jgi:hypothetical protein
MKAALWLLVLSLAVVSVTCWTASEAFVRFWKTTTGGKLLPPFTEAVIVPSTWLLLCPAPWMIYAGILTWGDRLSPSRAFVFASTLLLSVVLIVSAVALALILPQIQYGGF